MHTRLVRADELDLFVEAGGNPGLVQIRNEPRRCQAVGQRCVVHHRVEYMTMW